MLDTTLKEVLIDEVLEFEFDSNQTAKFEAVAKLAEGWWECTHAENLGNLDKLLKSD